ncbi:MAG: hypothetical protein JNM76_07285 [Betaproteobacteria bacterium]|nr:hypothetical protein [Betaproteobacteria bacterium]
MSPRPLLVVVLALVLAGCAALPGSHVSTVTTRCAIENCDLVALASEVTLADYRGEIANLDLLAGRLGDWLAKHPGDLDARYWRGFARWRQALNKMNEGGVREDVEPILLSAVSEFETLLEARPGDIEAHVGVLGALGARLVLAAGDAEVRSDAFKRGGKSLVLLRDAARTNLRAAWVYGLAMYGGADSPADRKAAATRILRDALANAAPSSGLPLAPQWGKPEVTSSLAWMLQDQNGPNEESRALMVVVLKLRPDWRYARDTLAPRITK